MMDEQHHETQSNATSSSEVEPAAGSEADPGSGVEPGMEAGDDSGSRTGIRGLRRLRSKRLMIGIGALLLAVGLVVAGATVRVNKVIEAPGPTWNVLAAVPGDDSDQSVITVTGAQTYPAEGALRMTTVSVSGCPGYPVTLFDVVGAWLSPNKTILERDQVCPPSLSQQDVEETNQAQMTSSQNTAVVAALMETGMATRMVLTVEGTGPDQTEGLLQKGDVLTSITPAGGQATPTTTYTALRELLTTIPAGTAVELGIERDGEPMTVSLTTITPPDANSDGSPDSEGSLLGVYLSAEADSDIEATFGLSKVGGPSAGSMFALGIVDELTPGDLTGGKDIAGTGTIALDGSIGPIGGIEQKMAGAKTDGSGYFLAPASNCADVVGNVPDGLEVYAVSTLHEAVTTVEAIAAEDTSGASTCEAVLAQQ
ncbi:lon protease S16 C-terminal proteolytic domain protein [Actinomyces massiliensis F0489]|uniref:endopeptidase La n=2 Tax=Actinomyces TaxID=1654 RepID=J0XEX4_9ACTO|nr:lon protease S16 C-terminal proteolytic domain protein [Actinomyces massiliensis F0489]